MEKLTSRYSRGFGLSLIIMVLFNAVLTLVKESFAPLMKGMAAVTGHHWITHGIIVMALFFILGIIFSAARPENRQWPGAEWISIWSIISVIVGGILIAGYYLI